jgi:hypothetical protein
MNMRKLSITNRRARLFWVALCVTIALLVLAPW